MFEKTFIIWLGLISLVRFGPVFEGAKVFYLWLGSVILIIYWLKRIYLNKDSSISKALNKWDLFYWLWIFVLSISSLIGVHPADSFLGGSYRHQGVIFFISLWLIGKTYYLTSSENKSLFKKILTFAVFIQFLIFIIQLLFKVELVMGKPIGFIGETNALAGFFASFLYFVDVPAVILGTLLVIIITQSRTAIIMFSLYLLGKMFVNKKKHPAILIPLLLLVSIVFVLKGSFLGKNVIPSVFVEDRRLYYNLALNAISDKPLLGYGAETGAEIFNKQFADIKINLMNLVVDRSHNLFLDVALWSGIIGLLFFCLWLFGNIFQMFKNRSIKKVMGVAVIIIFGLLQPMWVVNWVILFLIINDRNI